MIFFKKSVSILCYFRQKFGSFDTSEIVSSGSTETSIMLKNRIYDQCSFKASSTIAVILGGEVFQRPSLKSHFLNLETSEITAGPNLKAPRVHSGCVSFKLGGRVVGIVAGGIGVGKDGQGFLDTVEVLDFKEDQLRWRTGTFKL